MRHRILVPLLAGGSLVLAGCGGNRHDEVSRAIDSVAAIDQENMQEIMLAAADPAEAVTYFTGAVERNPGSISAHRGLARSLVRARQPAEAVTIWRKVVEMPETTLEDRVMLADALLRDNRWDQAEATLNSIPPTHETFDRYRLEAMIADNRKQWDKADHFYETAIGLTARPAGVFNNWGFSKLTRGEPREAERLFTQALRHDPTLFTAKTNLVLARAARRQYALPLVDMTQTERAHLLHAMAIAAIRQGDESIGRGLLVEAIDTHPQHFEEAVRALRALEGNVRAG
ncbi:MAG: tetratricopeptide repeat protein [Rhodobacteraceae bacterium]|nr:tetratricopeptide repeat protein [Paracoccaceae bacterium]